MRYCIFVFLSLCALGCSVRAPERVMVGEKSFTPRKQRPETIIVDAGHGGKDGGATSKREGYEEKALTLQTALHIRNYLNQLGYKTVMTRNQDTFIPLDTRAEIANTLKADLFVSIHYNYSSNQAANGVEVYYYKEDKKTPSPRIVQSKSLAGSVLKRVISQTGAESRGVKEANFAVIRQTKMPAILVEAGFLSNAGECKKVHDAHYQRSIAWGIAKGVDQYLESVRK